jgi:putative tryptophan/tyrosine transport system substrate-binding protein
MMRRRDFITLLGGAAAWPIAARAQQPAMPVIGFLFTGSRAGAGERLRAFRQGLGEAGFFEGRNLAIEYRWGEGRFDQIPALATELVQKNVAEIFTGGPWNVRILQALTKTIPIVFSMGEDPVKEGVVESFAHPGGNVTGHSFFANLLFGKCLGLLREIVPNAAKFGLLVNPANPNAEPDAQQALAAAKTLGRELVVFRAVTEGDFEPAFAAMVQSQVGGVYINIDFLSSSARTGRCGCRPLLYADHVRPA